MRLPGVSKHAIGATGTTVRKYMQPGEQDIVAALIGSVAPRRVVEIGVNIGLTAKALLRQIASIESYIGVDVASDYRFEIAAQQSEWPDQPGRLVKDDPRFRLLLRGSEELPQSCDAVFIDGDHGRARVAEDSRWAEKAVNPGGIIVWHDYGNPTVEVTGVLDALRDSGRALYHVTGTWVAFEQR